MSKAGESFDEVWEKLKADDKTGTFEKAEVLSFISCEALEYAYNSGYANAKAEFERPQGEWIPCTKSGMPLTEQGRLSGEKWYGFKCSNPKCNYIYKGNALTESPFCQKCGADMQKGESSKWMS